MARSARCTQCPFCTTRATLPALSPHYWRFQQRFNTTRQSGTPKASRRFRLPPFALPLFTPPPYLSYSPNQESTHVTRRAFGRMPGQSTRAARNVIARSSGGDEKRALISRTRTLLEELFRKLSKRRELVVAGSVSRGCHAITRELRTYLATDTAAAAVLCKFRNFVRGKISKENPRAGEIVASSLTFPFARARAINSRRNEILGAAFRKVITPGDTKKRSLH